MRKPATNKDAIRRQNLSALLTKVHLDGIVSRSALGEDLNLSKTAIADLVSDLESRSLIERVGNEQSGSAGRPSQLVRPNPKLHVVVVNPEIDAINIAIVNFSNDIVSKQIIEMKDAYSVQRCIAIVGEHLSDLSQEGSSKALRGMILALPGAIDDQTKELIDAPSLGWRNLRTADLFQQAFGLRVWEINNARAATVSEMLFGAAKSARNAICLFSGVGGIGGGIVVNQQILEGAHGLAGEIGKMRMLPTALQKGQTFGELMQRQDIVAALGKTRLHDDELDALIVSNSQVKVHEVIDEQTDVLIAALETLRDLFDPEVIVLGGYLGSLVKARTNHILGTLNSNSLKERGVGFLVPRAAELIDMVLVGAAQKAWEELLKDPTLISEGSLA